MGKKLKGIKLAGTAKDTDVKCMEWVESKRRRGAYGKMVKGSWPIRNMRSVQSSPMKSREGRANQGMLHHGSQEGGENVGFDQRYVPSYPVPKSLVVGFSCVSFSS
jgi:hypothetical protein